MIFEFGKTFIDAVAFASRISEKSALPETEYIQVEYSSGLATISTLNLVAAVRLTVPVEPVAKESGVFCVESDKLLRMLKGVTGTVRITDQDNFIVIDVGHSRWTLQKVNEPGEIDVLSDKTNSFAAAWPGHQFLAVIKRAKTVVSSDPTRWAYQQFAIRNGYLVASDGVQNLKHKVDAGIPDMSLPSVALNDLIALLSFGDITTVQYKKYANENVFTVGSASYSILDSVHEFPVTDQIFQLASISATADNTVSVHVSDLYEGLDSAGKIQPETITLSATETNKLNVEAVGEGSTYFAEVPVYGSKVGVTVTVPFFPLHRFISKSSDYFGLTFVEAEKSKPSPLRIATDNNEIQYLIFQTAPLAVPSPVE